MARKCHGGDGDHLLAHGVISNVNALPTRAVARPAKSSGTAPSAGRVTKGARAVIHDVPGEQVLICPASIGMLWPGDAGRIVVTVSHGTLSGGRPDNTVPLDIFAILQ